MTDIVKRHPAVISERHTSKDQLELLVRGSIWDAELRAAIWHILELEIVFKSVDRLNKERVQR